MNRLLLAPFLLFMIVPLALLARQDATPEPTQTGAVGVELTGVNASDLPIITLTASVTDAFGQPILGLTDENFALTDALADRATILGVQNVTDDNLAYSTVLVIDVSSSMAGQPIERARQAALTFVDNIGENDPVAVYTFATDFTLVQDFTTDKDALRTAITNLGFGGQTGLYQGAFNAVQLAADAGSPRRAVVLLSDGAEFGGRSSVERTAAVEEAIQRGVPVYTIGLGFGIDRTYLRELADGTNGTFTESPTPEELVTIYRALADKLSTQYVITLDASGLQPDGTEYAAGITVTTDAGSGSSTTTNVRTPIPVPVIDVDVPDTPIAEPVTISVDVRADDALTDVTLAIGDVFSESQDEAPYDYELDPAALAPGAYTLTVSATDETGDVGTFEAPITIAALAPTVALTSNLSTDEPLANTQTVIVDASGQTPITGVTWSVSGGQATTLTEAPFQFDLDPYTLAAGDAELSVSVTNAGGETTTVTQPFAVASLPPFTVVVGIEDGQLVETETPVEIDVILSQSPVTDVQIDVNGTTLEDREVPEDAVIAAYTRLDPYTLTPGTATFTARITNTQGETDTQTRTFTVADLPPVTTIEGIAAGDILDAPRQVTFTFQSQGTVNHVTVLVDGVDLGHLVTPPWRVTLDPLRLGAGAHTLRVIPQTTLGQSAAAELTFLVDEAPIATATAEQRAIETTATAVVVATTTQQALIEATSIAATDAVFATGTERALAATGTAGAIVTSTASALSAQGTADARATTGAQAELNAQGTAFAQQTRTARTDNATATGAARATATEAAADAANATATEAAADAANATATDAAREVALALTATEQAAASATPEPSVTATVNTGATQAAFDASATSAAQDDATATAAAQDDATATAAGRETQSAQAEINAQGTVNAQATRERRATDCAATEAAADVANATGTAAVAASAEAVEAATAEAAAARLTDTARRALTATANAEEATATQSAQATRDTQIEAVGTDEATEVAQLPTDAADEPRATFTPVGTLIPVEVDAQAADPLQQTIPLVVIIAAIIIILLVIALVLGGSRRNRGR